MSCRRKNQARLKLLRRAGLQITPRFMVPEELLHQGDVAETVELASHLTGVRDPLRRLVQLDSTYVGWLAHGVRAQLRLHGKTTSLARLTR